MRSIIHDTVDYIHSSAPRICNRVVLSEPFNALRQIGRPGTNLGEDLKANNTSLGLEAHEGWSLKRLPLKRDNTMVLDMYAVSVLFAVNSRTVPLIADFFAISSGRARCSESRTEETPRRRFMAQGVQRCTGHP